MDTVTRPHRGELTALCYRQLRRTMRSPGKFIGISMNPVVMTLALGVLFVGAIAVPDGTDYRSYMVAGVALQVGLSCIGPSAVTTAIDQTSGLVVRSKTLPVRSWSVLAAQVVADLAAAAVALALVTVLAVVIGWRPQGSLVETAAAYLVLLAFYVAMIWVGILLGLVLRNPETLEPVGAVILVVLSFVSNAFLSPDTMPSGVRQVASWNPVSAVATTCRQLWGTSTGTTSQAWPATHPRLVALVFVVVVAGTASVLAARISQRAARPGRARPPRPSAPTQAHLRPAGPRRLTLSLARASARHPAWAVGGWLVLVGACIGAAQVVGTVSATPVDLGVGPSGRAAELLHDAGLTENATEYVLIGPRAGTTDPARLEAAAGDLAQTLAGHDQVEQVGQPFPSDDGTRLLLPFTLRGDPETAYERVDTVRAATAQAADRHPDLTVEQTGTASIMAGTADQLDRDFVTAETLSIPVTLVVLLVVFGAFVAAVVPVVLALTAVVGAVGLSALVSHVVPDSGMTSNMILLIGMAVGVDYSLFYLRREREERRQGASRTDAIETAAATSGHAVVFSGAAVIVSLAGLYLVGDTAFMSLASAAILVVAVAVVGSLTVLPALLVLLSRYLDRPRVPFVWRLTNRAPTDQDRPARFWPTLLRPSLARPALTMVATMAALAALALPVRSLALATPQAEDLPAAIPAVETLHAMNTAFPQVGSTFTVVVQAEAAQSAQVRTALEALFATQASDEGVPAQVRTSADGRTSTVTVVSASDATSDAAEDHLLALRGRLVPDALRDVPGAEAVVGGDTASDYDYDQNMRSTLGWVVGFVLLFNFLVMAATFRSVVVGAVTLVMNLLSTGAAFGVLVLVFQHHWADRLLGYTTTGTVVSWVPLFLFVVLVGLSMDYHVFVLNRIHEAARSGAPHREAVRDGIVRSAGVVTSAAVVMVAVFSVFGTLSFAEFKQLAVGLGVAVLLDVIVVRGFLLPAVLLVTGRWTWWPGPMSHPRGADHDGTSPLEVPSLATTVPEPDPDATPDRGVPKVYLADLSPSRSA